MRMRDYEEAVAVVVVPATGIGRALATTAS